MTTILLQVIFTKTNFRGVGNFFGGLGREVFFVRRLLRVSHTTKGQVMSRRVLFTVINVQSKCFTSDDPRIVSVTGVFFRAGRRNHGGKFRPSKEEIRHHDKGRGSRGLYTRFAVRGRAFFVNVNL